MLLAKYVGMALISFMPHLYFSFVMILHNSWTNSAVVLYRLTDGSIEAAAVGEKAHLGMKRH